MEADDDDSDRYSRYAPSSAWEIASEYEKGGFPIPFETYQRFSREMSKRISRNSKPRRNSTAKTSVTRDSLKTPSVVSGVEDSNVVYPGGFRLFLITLSLSLSTFIISLDRTIVAPAM